ncbi:EF-hand domain pair [Carex littledalei]|uniref:EF-hand domain pair n=1 Tax=Carex littledalei TaxID=544730 RepID=A0A833QC14_9POAL|nr:EF-hand domain pair [Carex littledalei]
MAQWFELGFIEDEKAFNTSIETRFASLDSDSDGRLTYAEMEKELMCLSVLGSHFGGMDEPSLSHEEVVQMYQGLFEQFDKDGDGMVDLEEFRGEMKEVMLAVANGLGTIVPVHMVVEEGSFLKRVVERELAKNAADFSD